jgi:hypothetical protein
MSTQVQGPTAEADSIDLFTRLQTFARLRGRVGRHWYGTVVSTKDRGELARNGFVSASIGFRGAGFLRQVLVGDYSVTAGFGLVMSRGSPSSNSGIGTMRIGSALRSNQGGNLRGFFRGAAVELGSQGETSNFRIALFGSRRSLAARLNEDGSVASVDWSGLVISSTQIQRQGQLTETVVGGRAEWDYDGIVRIGATGYRGWFDRSIEPEGFGNGFSGTRVGVAGIDIRSSFSTLDVGCEAATSGNGAWSWIGTLSVVPAVGMRVACSFRSYAVDFANPHAGVAGTRTGGYNETGFSALWRASILTSVEVEGGCDVSHARGPTSSTVLPTAVQKLRLGIRAAKSMSVSPFVRWRFERRIISALPAGAEAGAQREDLDVVKNIAAAGLELTPFGGWHVMVAVVGVNTTKGEEPLSGEMIASSVSWTCEGFAVQGSYGLFDSNSSDAVPSLPERSIGGGVESFTGYGRGERFAVAFRWEAFESVQIESKVASTVTLWKHVSAFSYPAPPSGPATVFSSGLAIRF